MVKKMKDGGEMRVQHASGYQGEDSMRNKAERMFGEALGIAKQQAPASKSAPKKSHMRMYKKGGHVKADKDAMLAKKGLIGMDKMKAHAKVAKHPVDASHHQYMKKGGKVADKMRKDVDREYKGVKTPKLNIESFAEQERMKKGGVLKVDGHHVHKHKHKHDGKHEHEHHHGGMIKLKHMKKGGVMKYAKGGSVSMGNAGEPKDKREPLEYSHVMMGEVCKGQPSHKKLSNKEPMDASSGQYLKKGGKVKKYAAGGAAKVRHQVANAKGNQILKKKVDRNNLF